MQRNNQMQNKSIADKVMDFLERYWMALLILILAWPFIRKYSMNMSASVQKTAEEIEKDRLFKENKNPEVKLSKLEQITPRTDIHSAAEQLAHHFGVKYSDTGSWLDWFKPKGWTENEKEIADIVLYQRNNYALLEKCYYVVTRSRNLTDDILEYVDDYNLGRIRTYLNI